MAAQRKAGAPGTEDIINAACAGMSNTQIARYFRTTPEVVRSAMDQHAAETLKPAARASLLALQVAKLQQLQTHFHRYAIENNDPAAGTLVTKISQRLAALTGIDQPAAIRMDITQHVRQEESQTSTQRMLEALRTLRDSDPHKEERDKFNEMLRQRDAAAARRQIEGETWSDQPSDC